MCASLVSPGISVTVTDESQYSTSGQGTIPLIVMATASNKASPTAGGGISPYTVPLQANQLYLATSQRDLIQNFGNPIFYSTQGTPLHGYELNEYGLWTAYSYLGIANQCYLLRADIDLASLLPTTSEPAGPPLAGTFWLDLGNTTWGVFQANGSSVPGTAWDTATVLVASTMDVGLSPFTDPLNSEQNGADLNDTDWPLDSFGNVGNVCVVTTTTSNYLYEKISTHWYRIGSIDWSRQHPNGATVVHNNGAAYPPGNIVGSFWIKGNPANHGASWAVKYYNATISAWTLLTAPFYPFDSTVPDTLSNSLGNISIGGAATVPDLAKDAAALIAFPQSVGYPAVGTIYIGYDVITGVQQIRRWSGTQWTSLSYEARYNAPSTPPAAGTNWFNTNFAVDIMYCNGENWIGYGAQFQNTDVNGVQIAGSAPATQSDGVSTLVQGDLWVDGSDLENYPKIYTWNTSTLTWNLIDNTDSTTPFGIIFKDARQDSGTSFLVGPGGISNALTAGYAFNSTAASDMTLSCFVDPDAPDPRHYPAGMLLFNTRYSTYNVKQYNPNYFRPGGFDPNTDYATNHGYNVGSNYFFFPPLSITVLGILTPTAARWVTASGNQVSGEPYMGRKAQRIMVVTALGSSIASNQAIRSEIVFFNLMAAPGYAETIPDFISLNVHMKQVSFCAGDTPIRLPPDGTSQQNWAKNAANASVTGEDGLTVSDDYTAVWYPWGLGINLDGTEIMIPPSAIGLVTMAYNDQVAYPWYAPAGFTRGLVTNASSVGYLSANGDYTSVILNQGQRDVMYTNNINPIAYIPNRGLVVYGQKTLNPLTTALDRINVARLMNYIAYNLDIVLKPFLFEPNTTTTRATVTVAV
jgi:hypothetical protein